MIPVLAALTAGITLVFAGALAGIFFAFSVAVMPGLDSARPSQAVASMRSINRRILNPVFLATFLLMPVFAVAAGALLLSMGKTRSGLGFFAAAASYVLGAFVPTMAVNVPLNDRLEAAGEPAGEDEAAKQWMAYSPRWTRWNSLRAGFCFLGLLFAGFALFDWGRDD